MNRHFLRQLGVFGFDAAEPVILAALISEDPLLLIGKAGTGKTFLLNSLSEALGLEHRHYNASLLSFDDLIGFPAPDTTGEAIKFLQTPATIWKAESVLIDELSRCKPEIQNKFFSLIHERRIQGMPLDRLRYRWAAMNPVTMDAGEGADQYEGSISLDQALADRFAFILTVPDWNQLSPEEQELVINPAGEAAINPASTAMAGWIAGLRKEFNLRIRNADADNILYSRITSTLLTEGGHRISPRRARLLARNLTAILLAGETLYGTLAEAHRHSLMKLALTWSLPHRAWLDHFPDHAIDAAHAGAITALIDPERTSQWLTSFRLQGSLPSKINMLLGSGTDRDTRSLGLLQFLQTGDPRHTAITAFLTLPILEQQDLLNEEALNAVAAIGMEIIQLNGDLQWTMVGNQPKIHPMVTVIGEFLKQLPAADTKRAARARHVFLYLLLKGIPVQEPAYTEGLLQQCYTVVREFIQVNKLNIK